MSDEKQAVRQWVWQGLRRVGAARFPGAEGRIPNFIGAEAAARLLAARDEWGVANVVKSNPDSPQLPVRVGALEAGKRVYMAVPRLAHEKPFLLLDPERLDQPARPAASIKGASASASNVALDEVPHVDLV
ncbi:MAG: 5-formyltetrahydrofolate cyclo-ligase, partial [Acidimicrobiia bacterium]|nr:5-formyltetrahydrofolate cyclo-ligase [Acidimicrobiia bacterium]